MKRRIEERKRCPFAATVQGAANAGLTPPYVRRRQRAQRPCHFRDAQVGKVPRLERSQPGVE